MTCEVGGSSRRDDGRREGVAVNKGLLVVCLIVAKTGNLVERLSGTGSRSWREV